MSHLQGSYWKKYVVSHTQLQAASLLNDIELFSLPAKYMVEQVIAQHTTSFTGTGILTYTLSIGPSGSLTKYMAATSVIGSPPVSLPSFSSTISTGFESLSASTSVRLSAISTGANLDQTTQGSVTIWVEAVRLP